MDLCSQLARWLTKNTHHSSAAIIVVVIPSEDEIGANSELESWHVDQVYKMTTLKNDRGVFPRQFADEPPADVAKAVSDFLQNSKGEQPNVQITVTGTPISDPETYDHKYATKYFSPTVINYVAHSSNQKRHKHRLEEDNLEGYGVCLSNLGDRKQMQVIYDMILLSDGEEDEVQRHRLEKEEHLTPLENTLEASINAANGVLREMQYMEKREHRMRKTAESINARVRWFSYFSVTVLLGVTFIQVTYLKKYFKKKKLM
jgi:p24 family protein delta-1